MRQYKLLYQKYIFAGLLLVCLLLVGKANAQENIQIKVKSINVSLKVTDEEGKVIPKASVVVGEGLIRVQTDENGEVSFKTSPEAFVTFSFPGYEKSVVLALDLLVNKSLQLTKSKLYMTSDDVVPMPFMTMKKRNVTGSYNVINGNQLENYPSTDIRNALTGLTPGLDVCELNGSPGLSAEEDLGSFNVTQKIALTMRGRNVKYIIDDIPTSVTEMSLDPSEIESITIIKDILGKAMYGPIGADGIVFIKTKRGKMNERGFNVNVEDGVSAIDRMPGWVSGADYARLANQAYINNGLAPRYNDNAISSYAQNDSYNMYYPSTDFREMMLKNTMPFRRANVSSRGGNDVAQYFAYLGYSGEGDIYKIGPASDYNRINARSNVDLKINDFLKVQFNFFGGLTIRNSSNYGYDPQFTSEGSDNPSLDIIEFNSVIDDITTIPPIAFPVYSNNSPKLESPWYAVSSNFGSNPIGNLYKNGYYSETGRQSAYNVALNYDMSNIIDGLTSRTYVGFNIYNLIRLGKAEDYIAYIATPSLTAGGADTIFLSKVHDGAVQSNESKLHDYYYQRFSVYESLNYEKTFGKSNIQTSLTYFIFRESINGIEEPRRHQNVVWSGLFNYDNKYSIQGVLNYTGTSSFGEGNRYKFFPSIGASWVLSEETFLSDVKFIDYMKLRAEAGILGYEGFLSPYNYRDDYNSNTSGSPFGAYSTNQWFGTSTDNQVYRTTLNRTGNTGLTWEKRKEFNLGIDASLFNQKLTFEVNYYNNLHDGIISQLTNVIPSVAGVSSVLPFNNYNKIRYYGVETGIQYTKNSGEVKYSFGGNATIQNSKYVEYDEPYYRFDYQSRLGKPVDAFFGLNYEGKFQTDAEASTISQVYDVVLHAGDLKYEDMNNDGIVDENDKSMIGHTSPRLFYALNAVISYRNFDLTIIGTGRAFYDIPLTNKYFWNGWGDNTYSNFVRDNAGGAYPNLTYYKVNNNFIDSDFWLTKGGFFKIQNVELAYNVPVNKLKLGGTWGIRIFTRGSNLYTFSKVKDVDPESVNSGIEVYPLFTTFTGGIKLTF